MTTPSTAREIDQTLPELPEAMGLFCGTRYDPPKTREFWGVVTGVAPPQKCDVFTADQMRAYATQHATEAIAAERAEVVRLKAECEKLRAALVLICKGAPTECPERYEGDNHGDTAMAASEIEHFRITEIARAALATPTQG